MKRRDRLFFAFTTLAMSLAGINTQAAPPEPFTSDFYATNPGQWLNKQVTLSVAYFAPATGKVSVDQMEVMDAHTFHNHIEGGHISVVAPPAVFAHLRILCGTRLLRKGGW